MMRSNDYHTHISEVRREPSDYSRYPNGEMAFNKRVVYEEDAIEGSRHGRHHHNPEIVERVEVVEYERVPEVRPYGGQVIYEEDVDVETNNQYYPRRTRSNGHSWNTFRSQLGSVGEHKRIGEGTGEGREPVEVVMASDLGRPVVVFDERRDGEGRESEQQ
ncbi:phloem specific protein [Medicago truncatula]|uniref:Phloem specific protein n=1 Tax=Medicago truncatula TaxID=3880 RepID=G7J4R8_MEDTR|nr:phloem specific protein [Medicago truncatula]